MTYLENPPPALRPEPISSERRRDPISTVALVVVTVIVAVGCAVLGWELLHSAAGATLGGVLGVGLLHLLVMLSE